MNTPFRLAGAAALCAALLLTACAKKTDQSTTTSTDTTQSTSAPDASAASTAPDASAATTAPDASAASPGAAATEAAVSTTAPGSAATAGTSGSNGASSGRFITLPVYPGATERKDQALSTTSNGSSVAMNIYQTKDDAKKVSEWYRSHLPASWKNTIMTVGGKTAGTFVDEHPDGDQSVVIATDTDGSTRIQLITKHGK